MRPIFTFTFALFLLTASAIASELRQGLFVAHLVTLAG